MAPSFEAKYNDEPSFQVNVLDSSLLAIACYPYPFLPILDNATSAWLPMLSDEDEVIAHKRLKVSTCPEEFLGSTDDSLYSISNGFNGVPRRHFRDHVKTYTQKYLAAEAVKEAAAAAIIGCKDGEGNVEDGGNGDGMRLVQLLISCAEAVACRDKSHASVLLSELRANALVFGSSFQRVASCFVQGLSDRLSLVQPLGTVGLTAPAIINIACEKKQEALRLVYDVCPYIKFCHFVANSSILEAFEGESYVHVVDLGMSLGLPNGKQWCSLIHSLANRAGRPPRRLTITAVGLCVKQFLIIGHELEAYSQSLGIHLEFTVVESSLENLRPEDIKFRDNEVLVINSILQLHCAVKESRGALNSVLQMIHDLAPKLLVLAEQDSSHNGPFFLGRFMGALHYYSAIFDSLDAMLPKYDTKRAKIEQFYYAEEIKNIVSCEGPARVERHERVDQWRRRMTRAGFQTAPIKIVGETKQWLENLDVCEGYTIAEEKGCLILGWKSKPIVAASCWKC